MSYLYQKVIPWHESSQEALKKNRFNKQKFRGIHSKLPLLEGGTVACVTSSQEALVKSAGKKGNEQEDIAKGQFIKDISILEGGRGKITSKYADG